MMGLTDKQVAALIEEWKETIEYHEKQHRYVLADGVRHAIMTLCREAGHPHAEPNPLGGWQCSRCQNLIDPREATDEAGIEARLKEEG